MYSKDSISYEEKQNEDAEVDDNEDDCNEYDDENESNDNRMIRRIIWEWQRETKNKTRYDIMLIVKKIRKVVKI